VKYNIPTYKECVQITQNFPSKTFFETRKIFDDYKFSFFNYRLAEYKHFKEANAFEMKGITFSHFNGKSKHHLMFNKFWELNQYPEFQYDHFKDKKIKKVMVKEDGNLISFIKLPNEKIISRVKQGFKSSFNKIANEFIEKTPVYYNFINYCLDNEIIPLFELVGENRIILKYDKNDLILLNMRNNLTGEYIDKIDYDMSGINIVKNENYTLEELVELSKEKEEMEGWVVQFDDDTLLKVKTQWYYAFTDFILKKLEMKRRKDHQSNI
jgi:T4 RnlA family RNA ligase